MLSPLPEWMYPPREEGWFAADLDRLPEAPRRTELLHGGLIFRLLPQSSWHSRVVTRLTTAPEPAGAGWHRRVRIGRCRPRAAADLAPFPIDIDLTSLA